MQSDRIIKKAKQLGLLIDETASIDENLDAIKKTLGIDENNNNLNILENELDNLINANDEIDDLENSDYFNDYENINNNVSEEEIKKQENNIKENKEDVVNSSTQENKNLKNNAQKNKFNNKKADENLSKSNNDRFMNKVNNAKEKLNNATHSGETLKNKASNATKSAAKNVGKKAGHVAASAGKAAGKATVAAGKALTQFIASNPYILLVIVGIVLILLLFLLIFGGMSNTPDDTSQTYNSACDSMSLNNTSLTKNEFIEKVNIYFSGKSSSAATEFINNADSIYDIATSNNINPELVVVRAVSEGFSPGISKNNYWGLGCYNTSSNSCISYSSFDSGVLAFVENVSQYDSLSAMTSKYAYIGSYWYNPGSSSVGGCYYYPYIKEFMSPSRISIVDNACSGSKCSTSGGSGCVATTAEDQMAYAKWQVKKMAGTRQTIFGIAPDQCNNYTSNCTIYAQGDSRWGNIKLGSSSAGMSDSGCAVTSIAIGMSCSGADLAVDNFDAGVLIKELNSGNCFTASGGVYWGCTAMNNILPSLKFVGKVYTDSFTAEEKNNFINSYDPSNHFIILHFQNSKHVRGHYVVYTETSGNEYIVKDPAGGKITNQLISEIDHIIIYEY